MLYALCTCVLSNRLLRARAVESVQDAWLEVDYGDWFSLVAVEVGGSFTVDQGYATLCHCRTGAAPARAQADCQPAGLLRRRGSHRPPRFRTAADLA